MLDAGPSQKPRSREEAQMLARGHFQNQSALLRQFVAEHPDDPRAFDARMRLADIQAAVGNMDGLQAPVDEAMRLLAELEKTSQAPAEKRADAGFRRVSLYLQSMRGREIEMRQSIVDSARNFVSRYPGDRRGPRLLVEVATICDHDPKLKRDLLTEARGLSREEALNRRITDDLFRLGMLDKPFQLEFAAVQGGEFRLSDEEGKVVVIVFWSAESPHCLLWLPGFRRSLEELPQKNLRVVTVSLDENRRELLRTMKELQIEAWPTAFDGLGWESRFARPIGINSLPTVFVVDKSGVLRALNARDNADLWVRRLLRE